MNSFPCGVRAEIRLANESTALMAKYSKTLGSRGGQHAATDRTIGSHPIFACQFRARHCAVDNAPIITLNGDHSYAHSAGFKPPFRIHYRRAAQIIAPSVPLFWTVSRRWHRLSIDRLERVGFRKL